MGSWASSNANDHWWWFVRHRSLLCVVGIVGRAVSEPSARNGDQRGSTSSRRGRRCSRLLSFIVFSLVSRDGGDRAMILRIKNIIHTWKQYS